MGITFKASDGTEFDNLLACELHEEKIATQTLNIYLLQQDEVSGYDTFDSAVVMADCESEARSMHPGGDRTDTWCPRADQVKVTLLGTSLPGARPGFICKSFNAS